MNVKQIISLPSIDVKWMMPNKVLVETISKNEEKITKSGIIIVSDTSFNPAMHSNRQSRIINTSYLLFSKKNPNSMEWETEMEVKPGDIVWHDFLGANNCPIVVSDEEPDKEYKLLDYSDLYVAKRGKKLIVLNGYVLCEPVIEKRVEMDWKDRESLILGKIAHIGHRNKQYKSNSYSDEGIDIKRGDIIIKRRITKKWGEDDRVFLEDDLHKSFDGKMYFIIPRRDIMATVEGDYKKVFLKK